jgi:hypothetical protein
MKDRNERTAEPVFSEHDREMLERDRASGFDEGSISVGRKAEERVAPAIDHVPPPPEDEEPKRSQ